MPEDCVIKHFSFGDGWLNINHAPKPVQQAVRKYQEEAESQPDPFLRYNAARYLNKSREAIAELLNVPASSTVILANATTGINTVFKNLKYSANDAIVYFSTSYGACQNILLSTQEYTGCHLHRIPLVYPVSDSALLESVEVAFDELRAKGLKPHALLIDTIVSMPGVRMPFEQLIQMCKKHSVYSVVDGAHGVGHIPLDLTQLDPDFFVSNCHKWLFAVRPSAVFYVPERNHKLIRTTFPTSHFYIPLDPEGTPEKINPLGSLAAGDTAFTKMFEFIGSLDNCPYYSIPPAMEFRKNVLGGEAKIQEYCAKLARDGGALVAKILGTEVMDNAEGTLTNGIAMVNVKLPLTHLPEQANENIKLVKLDARGPGYVQGWADKESMKYNTFMPTLWHGDAWWVRLSAQVYLEVEDFEKGGNILKEICAKLAAGEHLQ